MKTKKPSIKLNEFDFVEVNSAAIQLNPVDIESDDGVETIYNATFILWISDKDVPIVIPTNIYDECKFCTTEQAVAALLALTDNIVDDVFVLNDEGDSIEELSLGEIFDNDEAEAEPENTNKSVQ